MKDKCLICPNCKEEINGLVSFESGENKKNVYIDNNKLEWNEEYFYDDGKVNDYECPECNEVLFTNEEEAISFLKNEDELQKMIKEKLKQIGDKT